MFQTFFFTSSHLKTLLDPFNEIANEFIDKLKLLADGKTTVPMKLKFSEFTLKVISKVYSYLLHSSATT